AAWEAERDAQFRAYQQLRQEVRRQDPHYADLCYPEPVRLEQVQDSLPEKAVLLEYFVGERVSFLFAVRRDRYQVVRLPAAAELQEPVQQLRAALSEPKQAALRKYRTPARGLYQTLLAPVGELLQGKSDLIIAPDGILHYLPFEVLLTSDAAAAPQTSARAL